MKTNIRLILAEKYVNGQTDGMKLYKKETSKDVNYCFAANSKDAALKFKAGLTINYQSVYYYIHSYFGN